MSRVTVKDGTSHIASVSNLLWDDLRVSLSRATTGSTPASLAAFVGTTQAYSFSSSSLNQLFFDVQLPHAWAEGTALRPHIHWAPSNTNTGVCRWGLEYTVADINGVFGATTTVYAEQAGAGVANMNQIVSFPSIAMTDKNASAIMVCRLFRDASNGNDTFSGTAFGLSFDLHYQIDKDGSISEYGD